MSGRALILARPACIFLTPRDLAVAIHGHWRRLHQIFTVPTYYPHRGGTFHSSAGENSARHALARSCGRRPARGHPPVRARTEAERAPDRDRDTRPPRLCVVLPVRNAG